VRPKPAASGLKSKASLKRLTKNFQQGFINLWTNHWAAIQMRLIRLSPKGSTGASDELILTEA
jgi:hypothetical protein